MTTQPPEQQRSPSKSAEVGAWEPATALGDAHAKALDHACAHGADRVLDIDAAGAKRLREIVNASSAEHARLFGTACSARLVGWARVLTLADESISGCDAGAKSPVIAIARLLRARGDYPDDLTAWIKSVSRNRFLPYGSLMDRLSG